MLFSIFIPWLYLSFLTKLRFNFQAISYEKVDSLSPNFSVIEKYQLEQAILWQRTKSERLQLTSNTKSVFGFVELEQNATYGLGYKFTLERKTDDDAINRDAATPKASFF